jgi:hypothetical protein
MLSNLSKFAGQGFGRYKASKLGLARSKYQATHESSAVEAVKPRAEGQRRACHRASCRRGGQNPSPGIFLTRATKPECPRARECTVGPVQLFRQAHGLQRGQALQQREVPMPETGKRRPWYAVALVAGFGAVLGVATVFGLIGTSARGEQLRPVSAAVVAQQSEDARWRERMEQKIDALTEKVAKIEGRLEKR